MELLGAEKIVVVAAPGHRFAAMDAVPLAELSCEPIVHYHPSNGNAVWVDEFAARRGVLLPQPALLTGSPRTAAHLAAAGMGVAIVPVSALTPRPDGTVRSFDPPELRDVIVIVAAPHDEFVARFVTDLKKRGLPVRRDRAAVRCRFPIAANRLFRTGSGFTPRQSQPLPEWAERLSGLPLP